MPAASRKGQSSTGERKPRDFGLGKAHQWNSDFKKTSMEIHLGQRDGYGSLQCDSWPKKRQRGMLSDPLHPVNLA